ncbi:MAG: hypothetical protein F6K08_00100 [Okeania sp. SIO1H6]|nr:hypothetical protein [Okeania sp. SIO1H6]
MINTEDQELFEFISWFQKNYNQEINIYELKLVIKAAENANITVDSATRTTLAALMKQNNLTPESTVKLYLDIQTQNNSSNFVDELIDKTVEKFQPQISEAVFLTKAEIAARFLEEFNTPGGAHQVDDFASQYEGKISDSLAARKQALNQRFGRLLNQKKPQNIDQILETGKNLVGNSSTKVKSLKSQVIKLPPKEA